MLLIRPEVEKLEVGNSQDFMCPNSTNTFFVLFFSWIKQKVAKKEQKIHCKLQRCYQQHWNPKDMRSLLSRPLLTPTHHHHPQKTTHTEKRTKKKTRPNIQQQQNLNGSGEKHLKLIWTSYCLKCCYKIWSRPLDLEPQNKKKKKNQEHPTRS